MPIPCRKVHRLGSPRLDVHLFNLFSKKVVLLLGSGSPPVAVDPGEL